MLLVIDDAWTDRVALALQVGGDHCVHLLTTRLPPLAFAFAPQQRLYIPELDAPTGVELLARYVPALVTEQPEAIDELVSAVGGLPLALTLLGHYLASQALSGQPRRLHTALQRLHERQQRFQISMPVASNERSPALPSQTPLSLHTAIALSAQLLDAEALRVFCALSVFPAKPTASRKRLLWPSRSASFRRWIPSGIWACSSRADQHATRCTRPSGSTRNNSSRSRRSRGALWLT